VQLIYNHSQIKKWIESASENYIVIGGIKDWLINYSFGRILLEKEYPYRSYTQKLVIYEVST
jgi:hypothetical protein